MTSSVSGLLGDVAHVHQARSRCLRCCPGVAVVALDRPSHRARGGHDLLIRRSGYIVQNRPLRSACWAVDLAWEYFRGGGSDDDWKPFAA